MPYTVLYSKAKTIFHFTSMTNGKCVLPVTARWLLRPVCRIANLAPIQIECSPKSGKFEDIWTNEPVNKLFCFLAIVIALVAAISTPGQQTNASWLSEAERPQF